MNPSEITYQLSQALKDEKTVSFAYLFGSRAIGKERPDSDFDIGIFPTDFFLNITDKLEQLSLLTKLELKLEKILGSQNIDLVLLSAVNPLLRFKVIKNGLLIVEKDHALKASMVSRWTMEYLDLRPFLEYRNRVALAQYSKDANVA